MLCVLVHLVEVNTSGAQEEGGLPAPARLVFTLTTTPKRIHLIKPVIDVLVDGQTRPVDAVLLAVPPEVVMPDWLRSYNATSRRPGVLRVLHMAADYGPASKLLAALREGGERAHDTVVVFGDDDILYGDRICQLHWEAQSAALAQRTAFGTRLIGIGEGERRESVLEATGSVSVRASFLPEAAFAVSEYPDACRLSDDYWLSHHMARASVRFALLPACTYNFNTNAWPSSCGHMAAAPEIETIEALSSRALGSDGSVLGGGGDWRDQLKRYEVCQSVLRDERAGQRSGRKKGKRKRQSSKGARSEL